MDPTDPPADTLRIRLFGVLSVEDPRRGGEIRIANGSAALLSFLVLERHRKHSRHELAGLFWGDSPEERARSSLSTALWRLRNALEPEGVSRGTYLCASREGPVGFNADSDCWLDVDVFEEALSRPCDDPAREAGLRSALALYRGGLLREVYDDWAASERERFGLLYLKGLTDLMWLHLAMGQIDGAMADAQRILRRDPLREDVHRALMRMYACTGQRPQAIQQYLRCQTVLADKLEIPPMEETRELRDAILRGDDTVVERSWLIDEAAELGAPVSRRGRESRGSRWRSARGERARA